MALNFKNITKAYQSASVIALNTFLIFVLINLVLWSFNAVRSEQRIRPTFNSPITESGLFYENGAAVDNGKRMPSNLNVFDFKSFEGVLSESESGRFLDEYYDHAQLGFEYQPWSQYGPRVFDGEFLNAELAPNGLAIRHTVNPVPASDSEEPIRIFTFGGSTTFGSGLTDRHTWSSYLSEIMNTRVQKTDPGVPIEVVNYGRVGFYPTQELHLLIDVLRSGERPDLVIFLDGVNMGSADDTPNLTSSYRRIFDEAQRGRSKIWASLPIIRVINSKAKPAASSGEQRLPTMPQLLERFLQFQQGVNAVSVLYGVTSMFILQPDGHYIYPDHLYGAGKSPTSAAGRALKGEFYSAFPDDSIFIDMTDLFEKWRDRKAIMDAAQYALKFSEFVAQNIATHIDLSDLKDSRRPNAPATGAPHKP